ncbi:hypothetical protein PR202_gb14117 [Eleusine coracana subsp. coracana]|uniref:Aspergillus nuclease S1 n=1 Tax=Eleusine coracana subsp. coracana TaxID=191504 RepID=A0AAV5EVG0_ELECO|nr:hypothetical protein PR202_gb14117 [Eleusine coracana subsp. coracana]
MGVLLLHLLLVAVVARAPAAHAWGKDGHYMTCKVAESFLTEEASTAVKGLLPGWAGGDLAETCSWADDHRSEFPWSIELHFGDSEGGCLFNYTSKLVTIFIALLPIQYNAWGLPDGDGIVSEQGIATTQGEKRTCVWSEQSTTTLRRFRTHQINVKHQSTPQYLTASSCWSTISPSLPALPSVDPTMSLMLLAHFVGDIHQPLHCGRHTDRGGNDIKLNWYTTPSNLHRVWDVDVIEKARKEFYNDERSTMIKAIELDITVRTMDGLTRRSTGRRATITITLVLTSELLICLKTTVSSEVKYNLQRLIAECNCRYATESAKLACKAYEGVEQGSTLGDDYFFYALPVIQKRIAQGGVRLAAILNKIFSCYGKLRSS